MTRGLPVTLMRGGTSKGVFVREGDLPPAGPTRDALLLRLMGSPDPMQLDGLGGTHSSTSKVMAMARSERPGCDADYLFAQVAVDQAVVDWAGNCGNLTAAAALYALEHGWRRVPGKVDLFNVNTGRRVRAELSEGVGGASTVRAAFLDPAGAVTGALLPTGQAREWLETSTGDRIEVTIADVSGAVCFARAADLGVEPLVRPADANADAALLARAEALRAAAGERIGRTSPGSPRLLLVAAPRDHVLADGRAVAATDHDLVARAFSMQKMHHACPVTVLQCAAVAARLPGSVPAALATGTGPVFRLANPKAVLKAEAAVAGGAEPTVEWVALTYSARTLLDGVAYLS